MTARLCTFPGCDHLFDSRGYCHAHAQQLRRGNSLKPLRAYTPRPARKPVSKPTAVFTDPVWGTLSGLMSKAPRWSGRAGSYQ